MGRALSFLPGQRFGRPSAATRCSCVWRERWVLAGDGDHNFSTATLVPTPLGTGKRPTPLKSNHALGGLGATNHHGVWSAWVPRRRRPLHRGDAPRGDLRRSQSLPRLQELPVLQAVREGRPDLRNVQEALESIGRSAEDRDRQVQGLDALALLLRPGDRHLARRPRRIRLLPEDVRDPDVDRIEKQRPNAPLAVISQLNAPEGVGPRRRGTRTAARLASVGAVASWCGAACTSRRRPCGGS